MGSSARLVISVSARELEKMNAKCPPAGAALEPFRTQDVQGSLIQGEISGVHDEHLQVPQVPRSRNCLLIF
jgi:hypothetical protein